MRTVEKVWGSERIVVNTDAYCGKIMTLLRGYRCSWHYHRAKDETFYVLEGRVLLEMRDATVVLEPGDSARILPGARHRFTGLADARFVEFSTHDDPDDSYRLTESARVPNEEWATLVREHGA